MEHDASDRKAVIHGAWIPREPSQSEPNHPLGRIRYVAFETVDGCEVRFHPIASEASDSPEEREPKPRGEDPRKED